MLSVLDKENQEMPDSLHYSGMSRKIFQVVTYLLHMQILSAGSGLSNLWIVICENYLGNHMHSFQVIKYSKNICKISNKGT